MSRIELRRVSKRYGDVAVLRDIDLTIEPAEFCVFIGPSGCGKSTLLRMIAGLEDTSSGEIEIDHRVVNELPPSQRHVAMVFQSYALYPHMSVHENMAFGLRYQKIPADEIAARVGAAAKMLNLEPLLERKPRALSGGQRQRVAIGRAIVRKPKVFLFDEPLSNLDASLRVKTRVEIARLHRDLGNVSVVYVTHDQVEAMTLADKIVLLRPDAASNGRPSIAQIGAPLDLYNHPRNLFVAGFIGSPSMNFLEAHVLAIDPDGVTLRLASGLETTAAVSGTGLRVGDEVTLGIRPEHVALGRGPGRGVVTHLEHLGESVQVYLQIGNQREPLVFKGDAAGVRLAQTLSLDLPARHAHVFKADGDAVPRLAAPEPGAGAG